MLSIITPVLNTHEIVGRQILHYGKMNLPDSVEIIYVDDGSNPPIRGKLKNFTVYKTGDTRPWTEHKARNIGARIARGDYLLMIDVDYVVPKETIETALKFSGDRMHFQRWFGVLDENGDIKCDAQELKQWGLKDKWIRKGWVKGHRSQFLIRKDIFWRLGGYNEALDGRWRKTGGVGEKFWRFWQRAEERGDVSLSEEEPTIFMFPNGKYCNGFVRNHSSEE